MLHLDLITKRRFLSDKLTGDPVLRVMTDSSPRPLQNSKIRRVHHSAFLHRLTDNQEHLRVAPADDNLQGHFLLFRRRQGFGQLLD
ncbi:hypothetical protein CA85_08370 [Allorhodopirellula solitaria]|uniref:Uncharacterized protein n=1 Tax=Allorhodopirellula solitaria TaxID=2527987 RepID=A0A5C5YHC1_9BACT|nr:hypothetical protein CA85_08370 [Allorhodopirellula solitaria]